MEVDIRKDLLEHALTVGANQLHRAAQKFREGSAARAELDKDHAELMAGIAKLRATPTPLEKAIENEVQRRK